MSKFTWSAAALSLLAASTLAAQATPQKPDTKKPAAAAQATQAKPKADTTKAAAKAAAPAKATASQAAPKTEAKQAKHDRRSDGTTVTADQIKKAQQALADKGIYKGKVTGRLNSGFRAALKKYQTDNKLKATGRLNQETLASLGVS